MLNIGRKAWDCDTCIADVDATAHAYATMEGTNAVVNALQNESFCMSGEMELDEAQVATCQAIIGEFMPRALRVIGGACHAMAKDICHAWYDGIC